MGGKVVCDENGLHTLQVLNQRHARLHPQGKAGGAQSIAVYRGVADNGHGQQIIFHRVAGCGIQNVVVELPVHSEAALVDTGGHHRQILCRQRTDDRLPVLIGILDAHLEELAAGFGLTCSFETHRATSLYSPWLTLEIIQQLPQLRFTADISHWVVVSERLLDDPCDDFSAFIDRVHHVQARVGYDQGPQVPHPAAPEYQPALAFAERFWQQVWHSQRQRGYPQTTLTPEFGADGYLHHLPFTNVPVADLWSLNAWMAARQQAHFQQFLTHTEQEPQP